MMPVQQRQAPSPSALQEILGAYNQANTLYQGGSYLASLMGGSGTTAAAGASAAGGASASSALGGAGLSSLAGGLGATMLFFSLMEGGTPSIQNLIDINPQILSEEARMYKTGGSMSGNPWASRIDPNSTSSMVQGYRDNILASLRKGEDITPQMMQTLAQQTRNEQALSSMPDAWYSHIPGSGNVIRDSKNAEIFFTGLPQAQQDWINRASDPKTTNLTPYGGGSPVGSGSHSVTLGATGSQPNQLSNIFSGMQQAATSPLFSNRLSYRG